jgi:hypothetical protein
LAPGTKCSRSSGPITLSREPCVAELHDFEDAQKMHVRVLARKQGPVKRMLINSDTNQHEQRGNACKLVPAVQDSRHGCTLGYMIFSSYASLCLAQSMCGEVRVDRLGRDLL